MAEKDLNKKKRKEPLITDEPVHRPPSKKKKNVTVWEYNYPWHSIDDSQLRWRKHYSKYYDRDGAMQAIKAELSTRKSWNAYFSKQVPLPFYWIGDTPPNVD